MAHFKCKLSSTTSFYNHQIPEPPPELKEWSQNTSLGVFSGLLFGGLGQWLRDRQAGSNVAPANLAGTVDISGIRAVQERFNPRQVLC